MYKEEPIPVRSTFEDLNGRTFSRWTVLCYSGRHKGQTYWKCKCDCGTIRDIPHGNLTGNRSTGCMKCCHVARKKRRLARLEEYRVWVALRNRNLFVKEWMSFDKFYSVVGKKPEGMKIVPIDRKRLIGPENWVWSSQRHELPKAIKKDLLTRKCRSDAVIDARKVGITLQEIGDVLGVTRERVRQLEAYGKNWTPRVVSGPRQKTLDRDKVIAKLYNKGMKLKDMRETLVLNTTTIKTRLQLLRADGLVGYRMIRAKPKKKKGKKQNK